MIRIYLDWNVVSNLKKPEFKEIKDFIIKNKDYLLFPYSPAHFNDLMKSYQPENKLFEVDLDTLEFLSEKHLLRWGQNGIEILFATPKEYFEEEKNKEDIFPMMNMEKMLQKLDESTNGNMGSIIKSLFQLQPSGIEINEENREMLEKIFPNIDKNSTQWDLMKHIGPFSKNLLQDGSYYKDFRKSIGEQGFKINPQEAGNWGLDKVIKNIDDFFLKEGIEMTYLEYVREAFKHKKEPITQFEFYTTAYLMLDMIGYKVDKLPKLTDNLQNIQTDGEHSFYGAYCDYFVASDKKLRIKSEVLYNEFKVSTIIIEPKQLISELEKVLDAIPKKVNFFTEAISFCKKENLVEAYPLSEENNVEIYVFKIPKFYFNFFNYVVYENYPEEEAYVLSFKRVFKIFSREIYYTEIERVIKTITDYFGHEENQELKNKINQFLYEPQNVYFEWHFDGAIVRLEKDDETKRPILNYIVSTKGAKEKND